MKRNIFCETRIRKNWMWLLVAVMALYGPAVLTSCSSDDDPATEQLPEEEKQLPEARIYETVRYDKEKTTAYNFEYPSTDPFGKPVTLSGTITVGDEVNAESPARGLLLYNHFTVYRADQCPSKGDLDVQKAVTGSGLITVSADYYGFGVTEDKQQAYCIAAANAQASVDALLAAKKLLPTLGLQWDDNVLFNVGYSQGGQTSMGVVRLIDQKYPDLHITWTMAGGGSYDIPETYRQMIASDISGMPSTVISVLLAYNEYFQLGIPREQIFKEPVLSHIDEWVLSKKYSRSEIDDKVGSLSVSQFATPAMLDLNSSLSQRYMEALEKDNLCKGWHPRSENHILLVHNTKDITVPVENTENLRRFLLEQGVPEGNISYHVSNMGKLPNRPAHEMGAVFFAIHAIEKVCECLDIKVWIDPNLFVNAL